MKLIPVDELERVLADRRQETRRKRRPAMRAGRTPTLPPEIVSRIRVERARGKSLGEVAEGFNTDDVPTAHGGRQWWATTVRAVLVRSDPPKAARRTAGST